MPQTRRNWILCLLLAAAALAPAGAQVETVDELTYPALPDFEVPEPRRVELDNGMVVMLLEDHELPLIDVIARVRTGARLEPADKVGLASLTGDVLRTGGTASMSGDEIDDFLESRAASIETSIGTVSGSASMSSLKGDFREVLGLFADVLRHPAFDEEKLAVAKNQANTGIARQNDSPQQIMFREFGEIIYGADSPYARQQTYTSVDAVTRDDLVAWHGRFYHPNNIILGLVGDFDGDEALAMVREAFGDWQPGPPAPELEGGYRTEPAAGVYYVRQGRHDPVEHHHGASRHRAGQSRLPGRRADERGARRQLRVAAVLQRAHQEGAGLRASPGGVGSNFDHPGRPASG